MNVKRLSASNVLMTAMLLYHMTEGKVRGKELDAALRWRKPNSVTEWEWDHLDIPASIRGFRLYWKIAAVVSLPMMALVYWLTPEMFWSRAMTACLGFAAFSLYMPVHIFALHECKVEYTLDTKGVLIRQRGLGSRRYFWKHLIGFEVQSHPYVPEMRTLIFEFKGYVPKLALVFDPEVVDEWELTAWIEARRLLPTIKCVS